MALEIMKLAIEAVTVVTTSPIAQRFFHQTTAATIGPGAITIDAAAFFDDTGAAAAELPVLAAANSYYNVYINGVLQMAGLSAYTPGATGVGSLTITVPAGSTVPLGAPVVLEVINFSPTSDTVIST